MTQAGFDDRLHPAEGMADIASTDVGDHSMKVSVGSLELEGIGQLDLTTRTGRDTFDGREDVGCQRVSTDDHEITRRVLHGRLFDDVAERNRSDSRH